MIDLDPLPSDAAAAATWAGADAPTGLKSHTAAIEQQQQKQQSTRRQRHPKRPKHPYLAGNFYPVRKEYDLTPCNVVYGEVPREFGGGQYLRNGGNAYFPPGEGQGYHFFDGDGMIHGVFFRLQGDTIVPCYVNKFVQTDVLLATQKRGSTLIPTIASLIAPISTYPIHLLVTLLRTMSICYLSSLSRLSVANTLTLFHNKKLLATCESGPMMRLSVPELETKGWEIFLDSETGEGLGTGTQVVGKKMGRAGQMLEEWTTGHPKVCPVTGDLIFYGYNIFAPPFVTYSVINKDGKHSPAFKSAVTGIARPKMMHDFAASLHHSIILDLPLTMDPLNIVLARPMLNFDRSLKSRFGVLPRYFSDKHSESLAMQGTQGSKGETKNAVRWFEDDEPSLIFHTADAWDEGSHGNQYNPSPDANDALVAVNMYACRFRTSKLVYAAGGIPAPEHEEVLSRQLSDAVRLTYFRFTMDAARDPLNTTNSDNAITHAFSLSAIPFDFPVVSHHHSMRQHEFVYGCTLKSGNFDAALEGAKIDCLIKINAESLRRQGIQATAEGRLPKFGEVDTRSVADILKSQQAGILDDDIRVFEMPQGCYGQEPAFVLKKDARSEDDGYLVFYSYDESQISPDGDAPDDSSSQLLILDASLIGLYPSQRAIVGIIDLPSRVPYGLHSSFVTAEQIESQFEQARIVKEAAGGPIDGQSYQVVTKEDKHVRPRVRSKTLTAVDRTEQIQQEIVERAAKKQADPTFFFWIAGLFWSLLRQLLQISGLSMTKPSAAVLVPTRVPTTRSCKSAPWPSDSLVLDDATFSSSPRASRRPALIRKVSVPVNDPDPRPHLPRLSSSNF